MVTTIESPVILSLCTGLLRGLEVGIEHAIQRPVTVAAYAEIEAFIVENLLQGMEKGILVPAPVWTDLKTFPFGQFHGKIHGIIGGYPCQPFSVAGNQRGTEDPRHLWPFIKDGIEASRPVFCFFENVRGHLNLGFEQVHADLSELGYEVRFGLYSAEEVGATHKRERLFILAIRKDCLANSRLLGSPINEFKTARTFKFGSIMGHSPCNNKRRKWKSGTLRKRSYRRSGAEVDNSARRRYGRSKEKIRSGRNSFKPASKITSSISMAYTNNQRLQGRGCRKLSERSGQCTARPSSAFKTIDETNHLYQWPSRPGRDQHNWEEPRTTLSGMGVTIDGYNFREDLLRGAGNGVVWQTATLAFEDLMSKFQFSPV